MTPTVPPTIVPSPIIAEAIPRRLRGKRSGVIALSGPWRALSATWMMTQKTVIQRIELRLPSPTRKMAATAAPMIIHGARRPRRLRVRSLNAPTMGWANRVKTNETVVTIARLGILCAASMAVTWIGRSTEMRPAYVANSTSDATPSDGRSRRVAVGEAGGLVGGGVCCGDGFDGVEFG